MSKNDAGFLTALTPDLLEAFDRQGQSHKYFNDVALWAKDMLDVDLWYKQVEIADDLANGTKKSIAVRAGHGVGKSFLAGILACWWIDTRPIQHVFVASTAPSADQVGAILWREIRGFWAIAQKRWQTYKQLAEQGKSTAGYPDHPLPGYITQENKWKSDVGALIGQGRKPPDAKEDSFQGIHAEYVLAIGDEACGLQANMIDDLSNITSNAKSRRLLIGNPTNPRSRFGDIFLDDTLRDLEEIVDGEKVKVKRRLSEIWSVHHISVLDSPNFHGGGRCECHAGQPAGLGMTDHALKSLTDDSYVMEKKGEYGEDSARYKARVLGEFAYDEGNNLFSDWEIGRAKDATAYIDADDPRTKVVLGVDVARSKHGDYTFVYSFTTGLMYDLDDETGEPLAVSDRWGGQLRFVDKFRGVPLTDRHEIDGTSTTGQATFIHQHAIELGATEIRVDMGGLGIGLVDGLYGLCRGEYEIVEMNGGGATPDGRVWYNNRDYQLDQMRERFGQGLVDIDPKDKLLITQLEDILSEYIDPHGALKIESKVSMKKRGVKSPDAADASWYACANLTHLFEGPRPGEVVREPIDELMLQLDLSGFYEAAF